MCIYLAVGSRSLGTSLDPSSDCLGVFLGFVPFPSVILGSIGEPLN